MRKFNRKKDQIRDIIIDPDVNQNADGSCIIKLGNTHVICTASYESDVPLWLRNKDSGWLTAEYGMLPGSTSTRNRREAVKGKQSGRTVEIQRLIGRSLRTIINLKKLNGGQFILDCDVLQADGGTRTAAITGAFVALKLCINKLIEQKKIKSDPVTESLAAISCGVIENETYLDLDYSEDLGAEVDANFVITENEKLVEIQMTSEEKLCSEDNFQQMLTIAKVGIKQLIEIQKEILSK